MQQIQFAIPEETYFFFQLFRIGHVISDDDGQAFKLFDLPGYKQAAAATIQLAGFMAV